MKIHTYGGIYFKKYKWFTVIIEKFIFIDAQMNQIVIKID